MSVENRKFNPENEDLTNEDIITEILEEGNPERLEALRLFHNLTPEQVKLFSDFAKLRKETHEQMRQELQKRAAESPNATEEELSMGAYQESIEPQVRETVLNLKKKGYTTFESGFYGYNQQKISFEKDHLEGFKLSEELEQELRLNGVDITIKPRSVLLTFNQYRELPEIEKIWDEIESTLPDLGQVAEPCQLPAAESFRQRQKNITAE